MPRRNRRQRARKSRLAAPDILDRPTNLKELHR